MAILVVPSRMLQDKQHTSWIASRMCTSEASKLCSEYLSDQGSRPRTWLPGEVWDRLILSSCKFFDKALRHAMRLEVL